MVWVMRLLVGVVVVFVLAGCSGGDPGPASSSSTSSSSSTTTAKVVYGAGDVAACKGFARASAQADANITDVMTQETPIFLIVHAFKSLGDQLEAGTVAAQDPGLVAAFKATAAAVRSAQATAEAWSDPEVLDLNPDVAAILSASKDAASLCTAVDPAGSYGAFGSVVG